MGSCHLPLQEIRELIAAGDKLYGFLSYALTHSHLRPALEELCAPDPIEWIAKQNGNWVSAVMALRNSINV